MKRLILSTLKPVQFDREMNNASVYNELESNYSEK